MNQNTEDWWCKERDIELSKRKNGQDVSDTFYNRETTNRRAVTIALARLARIAKSMPEDQQEKIFTRESIMPLLKALLSPVPRSKEGLEARRDRLVPIYFELWMFLRSNVMNIAKEAHSQAIDIILSSREGDIGVAQAALWMEYSKWSQQRMKSQPNSRSPKELSRIFPSQRGR